MVRVRHALLEPTKMTWFHPAKFVRQGRHRYQVLITVSAALESSGIKINVITALKVMPVREDLFAVLFVHQDLTPRKTGPCAPVPLENPGIGMIAGMALVS